MREEAYKGGQKLQTFIQIDNLIELVGDNLCVFCYFDKKLIGVCYGKSVMVKELGFLCQSVAEFLQ